MILLDRIHIHKHKRGVNCVGKFSWISENRLKNCLVRVFVLNPEKKCSGYRPKINEVNTIFLRGNT